MMFKEHKASFDFSRLDAPITVLAKIGNDQKEVFKDVVQLYLPVVWIP
ncbi:hypothetical protein [Maribacter sp. 2307ULW6-5]